MSYAGRLDRLTVAVEQAAAVQAVAVPDDAAVFAASLGIDPDPWQARVLRSASPRMLLNCSRQSGKSTTTAIKAVHTALSVPGALVLVLSPTQRQSGELFRKITDALDQVLSPSAYGEDTKTSLTLTTGSRIVSLPGSERTVRGFSAPALILIDEAARIDDDLLTAIMPMVATNAGAVVMLSTPWGQRGSFYQAWEHGGDTWERIEVPADQCPRIPAAFLAEQRREMPPLFYQSEYLCQFASTIDSVFQSEDVLAAVSANVIPLFPNQEASA
jgi:hypothetical protein